MEIQLERVPSEKMTVLENLSRFYVYEFSAFLPDIIVGEDGLFGALQPVDLYWEQPDRHPFFIRVDDELAGFALIRSETAGQPNNMDQFYVLRKWKGRGVGTEVAKQIFDLFPGSWTVTQIQNNQRAQAFWRHVISEYTSGRYAEHQDERGRVIQTFTSPTREDCSFLR